MKTLEKLLSEYKIRFKETEEVDEATYPFEDYERISPSAVLVGKNIEGTFTMRNSNGLVFYNGTWATAKITEKPKMLVIEADHEHPRWDDFKRMVGNYPTVDQDKYIGITDGSHKHVWANDDLLIFAGYQFLTLDQWAELFLDEPKEGEFEKAVKPAIRYLLKHHNPHTKIFIDYDTAELLCGEAVVSLKTLSF